MTTRSRFAFLVACSAAVLGLTTASAFAADAPAGQPAAQSSTQAAPHHANKKMSAHHAKAKKSHTPMKDMKAQHAKAPKTPA